MNKDKAKYILLSILILLFVYCNKFAQEVRKIDKMYNGKGWTILGLENFRPTDKITIVNKNGCKIIVREYENKNKNVGFNAVLVNYDRTNVREKANIVLAENKENTLYQVNSVLVYEIDGRILAYNINLVEVFVDGYPNYTTKNTGGLHRVFYLDEDNNGSFEVRFEALYLSYFPAWVCSYSK